MYLLILFLPLIGSLFTGFGGRSLGYYGASIFATFCVFGSMLLSIIAFFEIGFSGTICYLSLGTWIDSGALNICWSFLFDSLTVSMLIVVTAISTLIHLYSINYMEDDPHFPRFMAYLEIFTFFMLVLITADNLIQMFIGWEGVGLASYLLINFWFTRLAANQSAIKALVVNRVGDFGLSLSIFITFYLFQSVDYLTIFSLAPFMSEFYFLFMGISVHGLTLIGLCLFIGAIGKSAQLGLHTWLPDAMEGPTPVSALIHAATMVTAGVFLMIRFSPLLEFSPIILTILVIFGSLTAFFAAITGIFQNDLKRVIAYSTCSQLGYMIFACGISCYNVSMFHLFNHAFLKLYFLSAGSVIHAVSDEQDMRRMGSLINFLPATYSMMLIGSLALAGFPFLTGFYSKDFILELTQTFLEPNSGKSFGAFACWLGNISVFFTAFYSFRLIYLTFVNNANLNRILFINIHESSFFMLFPLIILSLGSIFIGYITKDLFIGIGTDFWKNAIFNLPQNVYFIEAESLFLSAKWLPFNLSIFGIILASFINLGASKIYLYWKPLRLFLFLINKKWYWDNIFNKILVLPILQFGYIISFKNIDRGFIELLGPYGSTFLMPKWARVIGTLQSGQLTHYLFFILLSLCVLSSFILIKIFNFNTYLFSFYLVLLFFI
uniref:NADH-ubiquinone oxidoreductase chain 5 n=1 Tax=Schizymenia dubyi TaxID=38368 RepID=A0A0E3DBD5_9FLOR|nr:NADH dehydrogenase subunit 5 [Schizymenia dubyi]